MGYTLADPSLKLKFVDVAGEISRTYVFAAYDEITITGSLMCSVDKDGTHRIWDGTNAHIIRPNWLHLYFQVADGGTIFKF